MRLTKDLPCKNPTCSQPCFPELPAAAAGLHVGTRQEAHRQPQELVNGVSEIQGDPPLTVCFCLLVLFLNKMMRRKRNPQFYSKCPGLLNCSVTRKTLHSHYIHRHLWTSEAVPTMHPHFKYKKAHGENMRLKFMWRIVHRLGTKPKIVHLGLLP